VFIRFCFDRMEEQGSNALSGAALFFLVADFVV
jgi:hypothetical protein